MCIRDRDLTVDGVTYPFKDQGTEDPYLYVYLTEGKHTINEKRVSYEYSSTKKELLYKPVKADLNFFIPPTMTYDGGERIFPVSVKSDAPYSDNNVAVSYYDSEGTELESAPVNAGKYFIRAYLEETEEHVSAELDLATLTIMPAELTVMDANAKDRDYDSSSKPVSYTHLDVYKRQFHNCTHQSFTDTVCQFHLFSLIKITFHRMHDDINASAGSLVFWKCIG